MNNPQKELGFIQIATGSPENDVLCALISAQLTGVEYQVVLFILRKTWGYEGKKEDWIALDQFVEVTGRTQRGVLNAIFSLEERQVILRRKDARRVYYSFNKRFHAWSLLNSPSLNKSSVKGKKDRTPVHPITELPFTSRLNKSSDTKENVTKETITKETPTEISPIFSPSHFMPEFIASPDGDQPEKPKKKKQPFTYEDYAELTRIMKKVLGLTTLENGKSPQENYARHILLKILKIMTKELYWPEQEAIDNIRANMEEFCQSVQRAREKDSFLMKKLVTLKDIYFRLPEILELTKSKPKVSTHLSL